MSATPRSALGQPQQWGQLLGVGLGNLLRLAAETDHEVHDPTQDIVSRGTPGRFFGWATPLMRRQVRTSITADLEWLRACLES